MGQMEKYVARSFFFWMLRFLRTKYEKVEIVFIAHHTEAKEVTEEAFFSKGESGGTICSSAYRKALEIIDERYPPSRYNIYPFHFSDGDNLTSDNDRCVKLVRELMEKCNMFGYGEVNQYNSLGCIHDKSLELQGFSPSLKAFLVDVWWYTGIGSFGMDGTILRNKLRLSVKQRAEGKFPVQIDLVSSTLFCV